MPKLTDTQLVILSAAAQRDDGNVLPLPKSITLNKGAIASVLKSLVKKNMIAERPTPANAAVWRQGDDGARLMLVITDAGLNAIGFEDAKEAPSVSNTVAQAGPPAKQSRKPSASRAAKSDTKQATLIDLLKRKKGASIEEMIYATGWQAHSVRGAISGTLKKKLGLPITSALEGGRGRVYRIVESV